MKTCILLSTFNGEKYLEEQLDSLKSQTLKDVFVFVRDDGSSDSTRKILLSNESETLNWYSGENVGAARSFMTLVNDAPEADYYSFCDQDDYLLPEKFETAENILEKSNNKLKLYYSNVIITDKSLHVIKKSAYDPNSGSLKKMLLRNYVTGCTAVFSKGLLEALKSYSPGFIYMHDWWSSLVCLSLDGEVFFDENAYILYRQHSENVLGYKMDRKSTVFEKMINKPDRYVRKNANELIKGYGAVMPEENRKSVWDIANYYNSISSKMRVLSDPEYYPDESEIRRNDRIAFLLNRK